MSQDKANNDNTINSNEISTDPSETINSSVAKAELPIAASDTNKQPTYQQPYLNVNQQQQQQQLTHLYHPVLLNNNTNQYQIYYTPNVFDSTNPNANPSQYQSNNTTPYGAYIHTTSHQTQQYHPTGHFLPDLVYSSQAMINPANSNFSEFVQLTDATNSAQSYLGMQQQQQRQPRQFVPLYCGTCRDYGCRCFYGPQSANETTTTHNSSYLNQPGLVMVKQPDVSTNEVVLAAVPAQQPSVDQHQHQHQHHHQHHQFTNSHHKTYANKKSLEEQHHKYATAAAAAYFNYLQTSQLNNEMNQLQQQQQQQQTHQQQISSVSSSSSPKSNNSNNADKSLVNKMKSNSETNIDGLNENFKKVLNMDRPTTNNNNNSYRAQYKQSHVPPVVHQQPLKAPFKSYPPNQTAQFSQIQQLIYQQNQQLALLNNGVAQTQQNTTHNNNNNNNSLFTFYQASPPPLHSTISLTHQLNYPNRPMNPVNPRNHYEHNFDNRNDKFSHQNSQMQQHAAAIAAAYMAAAASNVLKLQNQRSYDYNPSFHQPKVKYFNNQQNNSNFKNNVAQSTSSSSSSPPLSVSSATNRSNRYNNSGNKNGAGYSKQSQRLNTAYNQSQTLCRLGVNCKFNRENKCKYYHPNASSAAEPSLINKDDNKSNMKDSNSDDSIKTVNLNGSNGDLTEKEEQTSKTSDKQEPSNKDEPSLSRSSSSTSTLKLKEDITPTTATSMVILTS